MKKKPRGAARSYSQKYRSVLLRAAKIENLVVRATFQTTTHKRSDAFAIKTKTDLNLFFFFKQRCDYFDYITCGRVIRPETIPVSRFYDGHKSLMIGVKRVQCVDFLNVFQN